MDSVYGTTTNSVMRSQGYTSGPGMEAGRPYKCHYTSVDDYWPLLCWWFNAKMDAVCYQGRIPVGLAWGVLWLWGLMGMGMIRAVECCHVLFQGGSSGPPVPRSQYPCLVYIHVMYQKNIMKGRRVTTWKELLLDITYQDPKPPPSPPPSAPAQHHVETSAHY